MNAVIYVDSLLAVNLFTGAVLLLCTSRLSGAGMTRTGFFAGCVVCSVSSLLIFLPQMPVILSAAVKTALSLLITAISFKASTIRAFIKVWLAFMGANVAFAGIILAVKMLLSPGGLIYVNGAVYYDISALALCAMFAACYALVLLYSRLAQRRSQPGDTVELTITLAGKCTSCNALVDTGSSLTESFSGRPVIVAELQVAQKLLNTQELSAFTDLNVQQELPASIADRYRLVPYRAVGKSGLLPAFRADNVRASGAGRSVNADNVYIAIVSFELSAGEYRAVAGAKLFDA